MFVNGKLTKKKKTPTSEKLVWNDCETLTFELNSTPNNTITSASSNPIAGNCLEDRVAFMMVLSWSSDANLAHASSPSSPETPDNGIDNGPPSGSRKDRHIGHFILGQECWQEMTGEPRKQFSKWAKLM